MQPQNLWAPWRMTYIEQLDAPAAPPAASSADTGPARSAPPACFLCDAAATPTGPEGEPLRRQRLVLLHDPRGLILLNRYPYTSGHLLVALAEHLGDLTDLSPAQRAGLMELTALAQQAVSLAFHPQGFNLGINLGRCAGAGLPGHLHVHLVPRWNGDTNFMQTVGGIRVIPQALEETYQRLAAAMPAVAPSA